jgi:hypothetical protein
MNTGSIAEISFPFPLIEWEIYIQDAHFQIFFTWLHLFEMFKYPDVELDTTTTRVIIAGSKLNISNDLT